ncbi:MAG: hypothetical protein ACRD0Z_07880 [Acidimicrobiales bacterium]
MSEAGAVGVRRQAEAVGSLVYVERRLFEQLGAVAGRLRAGWAGWASSASLRAAWRAEQLAALLPVSVGLPAPDDLVKPRQAGLVEGLADLVSPPATGPDLGRNVLYLYDELLAAYARELKNSSPVADEPYAIVLRRVMADLGDDRSRLHRCVEAPGRST